MLYALPADVPAAATTGVNPVAARGGVRAGEGEDSGAGAEGRAGGGEGEAAVAVWRHTSFTSSKSSQAKSLSSPPPSHSSSPPSTTSHARCPMVVDGRRSFRVEEPFSKVVATTTPRLRRHTSGGEDAEWSEEERSMGRGGGRWEIGGAGRRERRFAGM